MERHAGGPEAAGKAAMTAVRARVTAGNPPHRIPDAPVSTSRTGASKVWLADLNDVASKGRLGQDGASRAAEFSKYNGKWIASPVNVHSTNWVWPTRKCSPRPALTSERRPGTNSWRRRRKVQKAGFMPSRTVVSHGRRHLFDGVAISTAASINYRKALSTIDRNHQFATTEKVIPAHVATSQSGRQGLLRPRLEVASGMVISGKAGFQMMGDWAKVNYQAKKGPGKDFLCFRTPGTQGVVSFNSIIRNVQGRRRQVAARAKLASAIMDRAFNRRSTSSRFGPPAPMYPNRLRCLRQERA